MLRKQLFAAVLTVAGFCTGEAMASVVGGGAAATLYNQPGFLTPSFTPYADVSSGTAEQALLVNNAALLGLTPGTTVDFAGSDSVLSVPKILSYQASHQSPSVPTNDPNNWGPLIQIPSAITFVTIPYRKSGVTALALSSAQLCGIFSGTISNWGQLGYSAGPITVVYRSGGSGMTELLTRHLNSQCPAQITTHSAFNYAIVGGSVPAGAVAVTSNVAMAAAVASIEGSIGYAGPEDVEFFNNAKVARVNGQMPAFGTSVAQLVAMPPPSNLPGAPAEDRSYPGNWAKVLPNPVGGYPIVGYTFLLFSQCYKDSSDTMAIRVFLARHYSVNPPNSDNLITSNGLVPLTADWKNAIRSTFVVPASPLAIGHTAACNGIGRSL